MASGSFAACWTSSSEASVSAGAGRIPTGSGSAIRSTAGGLKPLSRTAARGLLALFGFQLALNVGWSAIFFGLRSPGPAFGEILLLWAFIAGTAIGFWGRSSIAALLFLPYLVWTSFAAVLNLAIWRMNS